MRLHETHCHTSDYSPDGARSVERLLAEAEAKQLRSLCLTDHYDKDGIDGILQPGKSEMGAEPAENEWIFSVSRYFEHLLPLRQASLVNPGKPEFLIGIELGYEPYLVPAYQDMLKKWPFDQVLASVHYMEGEDIYRCQNFFRYEKKQAYRAWLLKLAELAASDLDYDILGHFDYLVRFADYPDKALRYDDFPDEFDLLFHNLIRHESALEINTRPRFKAVSQNQPDPGPPDARIIKRFVDLGGEMVSLSSDSHEEGSLTYGFAESAAFLYDCGVRRLCYFKERRPHAIALD